MSQAKTLQIRTSPHIHSGVSTDAIMRHVALATLPMVVFAVYAYGLEALVLLTVAVASCTLSEYGLCRWGRRASTLGDGSAAVTGLLYGLTLPPGLPLWMVVVGGVIAITLGKLLFGGLGYNVFNPALVGRVFLQGAFPVAMTHWQMPFAADRFSFSAWANVLTVPFTAPPVDATSTATPLALMKFAGQKTPAQDLALGLVGGSTGETCALLILLGGAYLAYRNMLNWRIPVTILLTVFCCSGLFYLMDPQSYPAPGFMLFAGGLFLGAVFMATDMVTAPLTHWGVVLYSVLIGVVVVVIRLWGGLPEGVQYAILLANGCVPLIDRVVQQRVYGTGKRSQPA